MSYSTVPVVCERERERERVAIFCSCEAQFNSFWCFCEGDQTHCIVWDAKLAWYSPRATHWICHHGFKHSLGISAFKSTWSCFIGVFTTWIKFLEPSGYGTFNFYTTNVFHCFRCFGTIWPQSLSSWIRLCCMFIWVTFKSHRKWSNVLSVSVLTTMILSTTVGTFHS